MMYDSAWISLLHQVYLLTDISSIQLHGTDGSKRPFKLTTRNIADHKEPAGSDHICVALGSDSALYLQDLYMNGEVRALNTSPYTIRGRGQDTNENKQ